MDIYSERAAVKFPLNVKPGITMVLYCMAVLYGCRMAVLYGCRMAVLYGCRMAVLHGCRMVVLYGCRMAAVWLYCMAAVLRARLNFDILIILLFIISAIISRVHQNLLNIRSVTY